MPTRLPAHADHTENFKDLTPRQQAAAISAMAINLENAMAHRIKKADAASRATLKTKAVAQLLNLARRVAAL